MENEKLYRESKITEILWNMNSDFSELAHMWEYTADEVKEEDDYKYKEIEIKDRFEKNAKSVYKLVIIYLESLELKEYLNDFKSEFAKIFKSRNELFKGEVNNDIAELYSTTVSRFWNFLVPFEFSQQSYIDKLIKQSGVSYLENILKNTQVIINHTNAKPTSEPQVYNAVKFVVQSVFPSALSPTSGFFKSYKNYNPDILIPEIHTAVEYKYADNIDKLKTHVDQIIADSKVYTGDINYQIFFAVFYVTDDFWGIAKFENICREMELPKNWKCIYIVGKK